MDILALLIFLGVILLAFFRKTNVGVLAMAVGVIAVRILGQSDKALYGSVSASMFTTLVGITLLFAIVNSTGALDLLARKIVALAGSRVWVIPIVMYLAGFVISAAGPGAVPALAIIPALAVSVAFQVGYNPVMLALIGECGLMSGRMSPITPEAAIITAAAEGAGIENVMGTVLTCMAVVSIAFSLVIFFIYKGHKVKASKNQFNLKDLEKFNTRQIISLLGIAAMLVLIIFCSVNIGLAAFLVAGVLLLFGIADDAACIKSLPWTTIVMVLGVGALLSVVDKAGGIDLMSNAMSSIMTKNTATPIMGVSAGLLSFVSSALGVVYPTMMPMCADIAASIGGVNPVAMMAAVGAGGSLAGVSPFSTGGALIIGAIGSSGHEFTKEEQNKTFVQLLLMSAVGLIVIVVVSALCFNLIANGMHPMV